MIKKRELCWDYSAKNIILACLQERYALQSKLIFGAMSSDTVAKDVRVDPCTDLRLLLTDTSL